MKYVVIIVLIALIVRIDFVLKLFDRASDKLQTKSRDVQSGDVPTSVDVIPMGEDKSLKQSPKDIFLSLLESFHSSPEKTVRERAIAEFKAHPTMFTAKLDRDLEGTVYHWRDLLHQGNQETALFLLDLMNILQGENLEMVKRFYSILLDVKLHEFLTFYSKSKDSNCLVSTYFGEPLPDEEKVYELIDREKAITEYLHRTDLEPSIRTFAQNCQLVLKVQITKLAPTTPDVPVHDPNINPPATDPKAGNQPTPAPVSGGVSP